MSDTFSAISILLVFITVLYDSETKTADKLLANSSLPDRDKPTNIKVFKKRLRTSLVRLILILVFYGFMCLALLPESILIVTSRSFKLWGFDLLPSMYVAINIALILFVCFTFNKIVKVFELMKQVKNSKE